MITLLTTENVDAFLSTFVTSNLVLTTSDLQFEQRFKRFLFRIIE